MKRKLIGIFIVTMLIGTVLPVIGDNYDKSSNLSLSNNIDIDSYIIDFMDNLDIPGLSAGIVKSDEIVWTNAYGYANLEENIKVENTTLFMLASISKTFTGTTLMQLYEKDYFELDDPINEYLPFQVNNPFFDKKITFQMLLTHTTSIKDNDDVMPVYNGDSPLSLGYFLEEYFTPDGEFYSTTDNFYEREPGTYFRYCNVAIALVGYLVEVISGMAFDEYCEMYIFNPLEMDETAWFLKDLNIDNIAIPYGNNFVPDEHYGESCYPAGQLRTSTPQLSNYLISMINNGTFKSNSILREETIDLIFTPHYTDLPFNLPNMIGIIWFTDDEIYWGHEGAMRGCKTHISFNSIEDIGIIILTNGPGGNNLDPLIYQLYDYGREITNRPPEKPMCEYDETTNELILVSVDPDNNQIRYGISWNNNQNIDIWTDYFNSSLEVRVDCGFHEGVAGIIAEDEYGDQSEWVSVTSKSKNLIPNFYKLILLKLIERYHLLEYIK
jgi:CubicO group peptidase (beta-lactamase class C family)